MQLTRYEMETIINFNEEEKTAGVYTHNKAMRRKLDALSQERPEDCRRDTENQHAASYTIPKSWVKIHPTRKLSEAQREALKKARYALENPAHADNSDRDPLRVSKDTTQAE